MTDQQISEAIHKHLGTMCRCNWMPCRCGRNHCTDLNAMHEAEKTLSCTEESMYADYINMISQDADIMHVNEHHSRPGRREMFGHVFFVLHATARQRAEAFLKTIGKWEEANMSKDEHE